MNNLKFAANLSFLFAQETPKLVERYSMAREQGFKWVECAFPYGVSLNDLQKAKDEAQVEQVLINSYPGQTELGEYGFAAIPNKQKEFHDSLDLSIEYAKGLNCHKIHIMSGCCSSGLSHEAMEKTYLENLKYAAEYLHKFEIQALIEPINKQFTIQNYFMCSPIDAFKYVTTLNHPNLRMQLDIYHLQILEGNLTTNIKKYWPVVGHIQIAQAPYRTEPFDHGEINYSYIFDLFKELKYDGYIGLEHKCTTKSTGEALKWLKGISD